VSDIVERLRALEHLKVGDPCPEWLPPMHWGPVVSKLVGEAADTIERLRSIAGKADVGPSFSEMTSELRHQTPVND
jgi:hypothetical protein